MSKIGTDKLERMLRLRDWSSVAGMKVDRKDMEALRVANDLQVEGAVKDEDTSFAFDSTPAANKVDKDEIEGGNMVNVIQQALEIRLSSDESLLDGAQTSAALMASDFLLEELDRQVIAHVDGVPITTSDSSSGKNRGSGGYAAAYGFDVNEYDEENVEELEDAEMSAMWGGGGIPLTSDDEE